tara:strand:+ start:254 stop:904 length:651 start_codon:yes stop_codon:yes gene_type:complete
MSFNKIIKNIRNYELTSERELDSVQLIAVSKVQPIEKIEKILELGHRDFGENRVQEAWSKWPDLKLKYQQVRLHLLGPLQTNKVDQALKIFDVIHSLDREKLAAKLAMSIQKAGKNVDIFVQVNFENELQKSGISVNEVDQFVKMCIDKYQLKICGLMCIPPIEKDPESFFAELRRLAEKNCLGSLSMGMSADYGIAIANGATHVRVGTAIFGDRA